MADPIKNNIASKPVVVQPVKPKNTSSPAVVGAGAAVTGAKSTMNHLNSKAPSSQQSSNAPFNFPSGSTYGAGFYSPYPFPNRLGNNATINGFNPFPSPYGIGNGSGIGGLNGNKPNVIQRVLPQSLHAPVDQFFQKYAPSLNPFKQSLPPGMA